MAQNTTFLRIGLCCQEVYKPINKESEYETTANITR